jgi:hypothetical protein
MEVHFLNEKVCNPFIIEKHLGTFSTYLLMVHAQKNYNAVFQA